MSLATLAEPRTLNPSDSHSLTAVRIAGDLLEQRPHWITFWREVLGSDGIVRKLYPTPAAYGAFLSTAEYQAIQRMLSTLRQRARTEDNGCESPRVVTVRMPSSLHKALVRDAKDAQTSMNQLIISRVLGVGDCMTPVERQACFALRGLAYGHAAGTRSFARSMIRRAESHAWAFIEFDRARLMRLAKAVRRFRRQIGDADLLFWAQRVLAEASFLSLEEL